jgi:hypothetical protein
MSETIPKDAPGKPTITTDDHADNYGQRGQPDEEGTKPTISQETHAENYGQRAGYHDDKSDTEPESAK